MTGCSSEFVRVDRCADVLVISVRGAVDIPTAPRLAKALDSARRAGPAAVVLDLSGVSFLCAAGLRVLADAARDVPGLQVVAATRAVLRPVEVTGMSGRLSIHADRERALSATAGRAAGPVSAVGARRPAG
ncbi:STAS domain-containing protein [Pseudonocardia kunmingensis]|uniref:Anti-sigma B factor antagonist n=1 Tax=Pseudonocardia kunmingensis TaxID=630975 RepID=A0A543DL43_9PSEU|nr:STAS domain-containing protein [Pseudonocardia kunmingensis]TQM10033.1 anti-sigma B factor antagonist [Pseudonocardia kunmingensis]